MRHGIKTCNDRKLYAPRKCTVEPRFDVIKHAMKFRRFPLRRLRGTRGECSLVCLAWNLRRMNALCAESVEVCGRGKHVRVHHKRLVSPI